MLLVIHCCEHTGCSPWSRLCCCHHLVKSGRSPHCRARRAQLAEPARVGQQHPGRAGPSQTWPPKHGARLVQQACAAGLKSSLWCKHARRSTAPALTLLHMLQCPAHAAPAAPGATKVSQCLMEPGTISCHDDPAAQSPSAGPKVSNPRLASPQAHAATDPAGAAACRATRPLKLTKATKLLLDSPTSPWRDQQLSSSASSLPLRN